MARHPLIGYLVWLVLFGAVFAWEGLALARVTGVPSLSDVFRVIMRYPVGRWVLFAFWLVAGRRGPRRVRPLVFAGWSPSWPVQAAQAELERRHEEQVTGGHRHQGLTVRQRQREHSGRCHDEVRIGAGSASRG